MCASRTRNAVRAVSPVPVPHFPRPGRSVSRNVAIRKPCGAGSVPIRLAPQGRVRLKNATAARDSSLIGAVPLETRLGMAKKSRCAADVGRGAACPPRRARSARPPRRPGGDRPRRGVGVGVAVRARSARSAPSSRRPRRRTRRRRGRAPRGRRRAGRRACGRSSHDGIRALAPRRMSRSGQLEARDEPLELARGARRAAGRRRRSPAWRRSSPASRRTPARRWRRTPRRPR